jgi:hypothetical protein
LRIPTREELAALDLSSDYGSEGLRFESPRARSRFVLLLIIVIGIAH